MAVAMHSERVGSKSVGVKASFGDFLHCQAEGPVEWVNGEIVNLPPVTERHADLVSFLMALLRVIGETFGIGNVYGEPYVMRASASGNGRSPDILFVRGEHRERMKSLYLDGPADIVVEIVSPSSVKTDYLVKRAEYERAGIPEYWIIDPVSAETTFLVLSDGGIYSEADLTETGRYASAALNNLTLDPAWFHQESLPKVLDILKEWGLV